MPFAGDELIKPPAALAAGIPGALAVPTVSAGGVAADL
jgi:hypothetical protein